MAEADRPVAYEAPPQLPFLFAEDRAAIQLNLMMVLKALNDGKIDSRTANSMTRILNSCMRNLKAGLLTDPQAKDLARTVIKTPDGDEIAPPREAPEDRPQEESDSVDAEDRPLDPNSPYADLWHLPSPEFAYRVSERAAQIYEAECAAKREKQKAAQLSALSPRPNAAEEPVLPVLSESHEPAVDLSGTNHTEEPAAASVVTTTAADSKADDDEAARRFREWWQSPEGQTYQRTWGQRDFDLDPRLAKILDADPDTAHPGCAAKIQAAG